METNEVKTHKETNRKQQEFKGLSLLERFTKRLFDFLLSFFGLLIFSPLLAVVYLAIKIGDGGPAIFKQERIGYGGRPFTLYKFRSMRANAESDGVPQLCQDADGRLTRVGAFLRSHHLDELPQLWNVLVGDMSFVGYRPERKFFIDKIMEKNPDYELLYAMRPGVFSYATLYNGYTDTMDKMLERLRLDLIYLSECSFWVDVKIIFLTVFYIISGKKF